MNITSDASDPNLPKLETYFLGTSQPYKFGFKIQINLFQVLESYKNLNKQEQEKENDFTMLNTQSSLMRIINQ